MSSVDLQQTIIEQARTGLSRLNERIQQLEALEGRFDYIAASDPGVSNDLSEGYNRFSLGYNTATDVVFICMDASSGAADWRPINTIKNDFEYTSDPTVNDDSGDGFERGSLIYNKTDQRLWFCDDPSSGAAVWFQLQFTVTYETIAFRSFTAANQAASTTVVPSKPTGLAVDDLMLATIFVDNDAVTVSPPAGWSTAQYSTGGGMGQYTFYKVADSGDAAASNFTFTASSSDGLIAILSAWSGVDTTTPVEDSTQNKDITGTDDAPIGLSVTTGIDESMLVWCSINQSGSTDYDPISGWTQVTEEDLTSSPFGSATQFYKTQTTAGASGNVTGGLTSAQEWHVHLIALNPASSGGGGATFTAADEAKLDGLGQGARVYNSSNISIPTGTITALTFNSERFDDDAYHSTSSNTSRLTVPSAGTYAFGANVAFASNATGLRSLYLYVDGTTIVGQELRAPLTGIQTIMSISTIYRLSASSYVEIRVLQSSGGNLNVEALGNRSPEFWIYRVK